MTGDLTAAWIAAGASLVVSLISAGLALWSNRQSAQTHREQAKTAEDLERLKSALGEQNDAAKARRDYEYEARKRLYTQLYPLAYQSQQAAARARHRIMNLALATRDGHLNARGDNWLTGADLYYFNACLHDLIAPLAILELMTRQLTQLDLTLDRDLAWQHFIAGAAQDAMRADFSLSNRGYYRGSRPGFPPIDFGPDHAGYDPAETRPTAAETRWTEKQERRLWRQGLYSGEISQVAETLLAGPPESIHVMTFAEFLVRLGGADPRRENTEQSEAGAMVRGLRPLVEVLRDFHPARRPATWRILLAQGACYQALGAVSGGVVTPDRLLAAAKYAGSEDRAEFLWVGDNLVQSVPDALRGTLDFDTEQTSALHAADMFLERAVNDFVKRLGAHRPHPSAG